MVTVFRLAAVVTFLAVAMGAVVCATKSGASCPTWPGCRPDQLTPQWQLSPIIEMSHRVVAITAGPLVLASALLSLRRPRPSGWARALPWVALAGAIASGAFGRLVIVSTLPTWLGAVDLFCALTAMTVMGMAAVAVGAGARARRTGPVPPAARLAAASVAVVVVMHVTGIFAAGTASYTRCMGWPLWRMIGSDLHPWLQGLRLGLAGVAAALVVTTAVVTARSDALRPWGLGIGVLFAAEMALGVVIRIHGLDDGVAAAYSVLAVTLLWSLGLLTATAGSARAAEDGQRRQSPRDHAVFAV